MSASAGVLTFCLPAVITDNQTGWNLIPLFLWNQKLFSWNAWRAA